MNRAIRSHLATLSARRKKEHVLAGIRRRGLAFEKSGMALPAWEGGRTRRNKEIWARRSQCAREFVVKFCV